MSGAGDGRGPGEGPPDGDDRTRLGSVQGSAPESTGPDGSTPSPEEAAGRGAAPPPDDDSTAPPAPLPAPGPDPARNAGDDPADVPVPADDRTRLTAPPASRSAPPDEGDLTRIATTGRPAATGGGTADADDGATRLGSAPPSPPLSADADSTRIDPAASVPGGSGPLPPPLPPPLPHAADPAAAATTAGTAAARSGRATVALGTLINNNYEVKEVLKAGGMGEVYRGENVFTGDPVAIKVVLPELAEDEKVGLMFMREARTLSQLADEAIVRYYNFVKDPAIDRYCLIMEFIRGVPLSDHTAVKGPITPEQGRTLMRRLAKGLEKAHAREVIHRDLSPDNVMLPDDAVSEAVLIDFGIAKSNVVKEGTVAGQFAGKFKYVSPEQLGHFGGDIGPATDIYGLALLIAAAVVGKPLDMGGSIVEAVQRRQSIPDLSAVPELLRPLIAHMLEPDPRHRPASMGAVIRMIDNPDQVPDHYWEGRQPPPISLPATPAQTTGVPRAPRMAVPGFQAPPTSPPFSTALQGSVPPASMSPRTAPPLSQPPFFPQQSPAGPVPQDDDEGVRGGIGRLLLGALLVLVLLGAGGGWYAWREGLLPPEAAAAIARLTGTEAPEGEVGGDDASGATDGQVTPAIPRANTREGFLAGFETGPCTFASRVSAGSNAGMVEGFATAATPAAFDALPSAYEERFGSRPAILARTVTPEQCAALDFARALQGTSEIPAEMVLDADTLASGQTVSGHISDRLGRPVWLVLVSPRGAVYNLTARLSESVGDRRAFRFGLNLGGDEAAPQLLMAVATASPLANAAAARDGAQAADLLPLVLDEILDKGGQGVAALSYLLLTPAAPAPTPAPTPSPEAGNGTGGGSNGTEGPAPGDGTP
jgi:serine/threonine-protein kinase